MRGLLCKRLIGATICAPGVLLLRPSSKPTLAFRKRSVSLAWSSAPRKKKARRSLPSAPLTVGNSKTSHVVREEKEEEEDDDHGDDDDDEEAAVELKVAELGIRDAAEGEEEASAAEEEEEEGGGGGGGGGGDDEEEAVEAGESFQNEGGVPFKQHMASVSSDREDLRPSPSVRYEDGKATVMLFIGQMVILDGCAMVRVLQGRASMLGYSLPSGVDVLVCSSSKLSAAVSIEARRSPGEGNQEGRKKEVEFPSLEGVRDEEEEMEVAINNANQAESAADKYLSVECCVLEFKSHKLKEQTDLAEMETRRFRRERTFKLELAGVHGQYLGIKGNLRQNLDKDPGNSGSFQEIESDEENSSEQEESNSEGEEGDEGEELPQAFDGATWQETMSSKKRKGRELERGTDKRQRMEPPKIAPSATIISSTWWDAVDCIINEHATFSASIYQAPTVAICGAKNAGKSTFARFLVNSMLNRHKKVAYLDTDVGQPEFTLPGCLSLHVLDEPITGPPAFHLRTPERCYFYGDISPKSDPNMYVQSIVELYHQFCKQYQNDGHQDIPLVINTHGWLKGVGYDVLVDILCHTCPTHVVQLLSSSAKKNLPHGRFWDVSSKAKTLYLKSAVEESAKQVAEHLRAVRVLAYFQQCFGEDPSPFPYRESKLFAQTAMSLVCHAPYQVPIWAVDIRHLHGQVPQESWSTVNGALVGLGVSFRHKTQQEKDDTSKPLPPLCIGLGIVRGVDMKKGIFYIITPISLEQLQQVDTLLQGRVEIPEQLLQAEGHISPYLCRDSIAIEGTGAGVMKSSHKQLARRVA